MSTMLNIPRPSRTRVLSLLAVLSACSLGMAGCSFPTFGLDRIFQPEASSPLPQRPAAQAYGPPHPAGATVEQPGEVTPVDLNTTDFDGSLRPDDATPEQRVPRILSRGRLIVGVDQSQNLLSYRDALTGELNGFEVELAREIARDIFGDPDKVDFQFVESASRAEALENRQVDMVIRTMTITRVRQQDLAFSTPYLTTDSRLLVLENSKISGVGQLPGRTVCVTEGSTALEKARKHAPQSPLMKTRTWADCLVALQQNQADAVLSDDTILSGMAAQDPYTEIVGESLSAESYAVAFPLPDSTYDSSGLIRQVNSTIERIRNDGTWWRMYTRWFSRYLATDGPPPLAYREEETEEENAQSATEVRP